MTSMPMKVNMMTPRTGGPLPPSRVPTMRTGGPMPPDQAPAHGLRTGGPQPPVPGNTGVVPPHMRTGGPNPAVGLYDASQRMRTGGPNPAVPASPDMNRTASDGFVSGMPQRPSLPPGMQMQQRPVSATGMPSQAPGPVGRPAGGLFRMMSGA